MAIPLRFFTASSTDHYSPSTATPTVLLWTPTSGSWAAPKGAVSAVGDGWWAVAADPADQPDVGPLLLYATASGADPTPEVFWPAGTAWVRGRTTPPLVFWLGTVASAGFAPAPGLAGSLSLAVSADGGPFAPGAGTVVEPGGTGSGNGFYLYTPASSEVATASEVLLQATDRSGTAFAWDWDFALADPAAAAPVAPATPPAPPPLAAARTLVGAVAPLAAAELAASFPGGVHKGVAAQDRPPGAFLCLGGDDSAEPIYTTANHVEVRRLEAAVYATTAAEAQRLLDGAWKPWWRANWPLLTLADATVVGSLIADNEPADETSDYAPKGGNRLNRARVVHRCWLSYRTQ